MITTIVRTIGIFILLLLPTFILSFLAYTVFHQIVLVGGLLIAAGSAYYLNHMKSEQDRLNREVFLQAYELKKSKEALESCLATDTQTQVYNERLLNSRLTEECDRGVRYRRPFSCLLVAVDSLPELAEHYGSVLVRVIVQEVADFLKENTRSVDIIIRQGDERFVAILPETQRDQARMVAERIRGAIERNTFQIEGKTIKVTVSIALISFDPAIHHGKDDLISALEKALEEARKTGPNQIAAFTSDRS